MRVWMRVVSVSNQHANTLIPQQELHNAPQTQSYAKGKGEERIEPLKKPPRAILTVYHIYSQFFCSFSFQQNIL
jgi:hypothetical protein